jgi:hypothetical protein
MSIIERICFEIHPFCAAPFHGAGIAEIHRYVAAPLMLG